MLGCFSDVMTFLPCYYHLSGQQVRVRKLRLLSLLPGLENYITYEGSITQPGCYETVTWIILNRPIAIKYDQVLHNCQLHYTRINFVCLFYLHKNMCHILLSITLG